MLLSDADQDHTIVDGATGSRVGCSALGSPPTCCWAAIAMEGWGKMAAQPQVEEVGADVLERAAAVNAGLQVPGRQAGKGRQGCQGSK